MYKIILKLISLYKIFNFTKRGDLVINYNKSKIILTKEGDIILNAKRHMIQKHQLHFSGCEDNFVEGTIKAYERGEHMEYVKTQNIEEEIRTEIKKCHSMP